MPLKNVPKNKYESFDDTWGVFSTPNDSAPVTALPVAVLQHFPDHRFALYNGERKNQMVESVKEFGVLTPLIVWKNEKGAYLVLSGHNRLEAAKLAGLEAVPVVLREQLSLEEATLIVTETNLRQRSFADLSHSERAYCLAQHYEASKAQGQRKDLLKDVYDFINGTTPIEDEEDNFTSAQGEQKSDKNDNLTSAQGEQKSGETTRDKLAKENGISPATFARYVKIATLHPALMELLDQGKLSLLATYQLAFIDNMDVQEELADLVADGLKLSQNLAKKLREDFEETGLAHLDSLLEQANAGDTEGAKRLNKAMPSVKKLVAEKIPEERYGDVSQILEEALDLYWEKYSKR